jgi:segregation and condensation protein A
LTARLLTPPSEAALRENDAAAAPAFVVELPEYSGPLDLLLALIREEEVDIADIPIARIAEQFLRRIHSLGLNEAADYLEMAARLLRIKAQMLLPRREGDEEWEDPRADLVRRLLEYQQVREVVNHLERQADIRREMFARGFVQPASLPAAQPLSMSLADLLAAVDRVLRVAARPQIHDVISRPLDVEGAIALVRSVLALRESVRWRELLVHGSERWQVLSLLLALLELARFGELHLNQTGPFADVEITRDVTREVA